MLKGNGFRPAGELACRGLGDVPEARPAFAPQVSLADVVVIRDGDARAIAENLTEREAEFQPCGGVFFVIVGLITREEHEVRILVLDVPGVFLAQAAVLVRVARKGGEHDLVLVRRFPADEADRVGR